MGKAGPNTTDEIESLRRALNEESQRCLELEKQLARAGAEFEEFISTSAHNLRESLRDVAAFSQLMAESYGGRLDAEAGAFLERVQKGGERMQSLLAAMVDYWATYGDDRRFSRADMEAVLCQALLCGEKQVALGGAIVTHDPLPAVTGDFQLLTNVLLHLLRNAVQYCHEKPPRIHVSSRWADPDWVISVQDNGPGIEPAFQSRIFGVFRRLHGKEYPGNGLGLAFCKKVIEWHGGRIWVESTPGTGSTFYFTLPSAD
jgi:light-regulated signal transduction histidine kinase (bacteriophytochrome)